MSIDNKPHQSEPFTVREPDGFGGMVERVSDAWYNYLSSIDREVNVTIEQNTSTTNFTQATQNMADGVDIDRIREASNALGHVTAQLLASQVDYHRLEKELQGVREDLAAQRAQTYDDSPIKQEINDLRALIAQLMQDYRQ